MAGLSGSKLGECMDQVGAVRRCCTLAAMSILCATNGSMKDVRRLTVQQDAIM